MTTGSRHLVGAVLVFLTLVGADSTHAQLRSLAAIKHLALESSPGAERQTEALRTHDSTHRTIKVCWFRHSTVCRRRTTLTSLVALYEPTSPNH